MKEISKNEQEAKKSLRHHIKLFKNMLENIRGEDDILKSRAVWGAWCLHKYINEQWLHDIAKEIKSHPE